MSLPDTLKGKLNLPVLCSAMFIISIPQIVVGKNNSRGNRRPLTALIPHQHGRRSIHMAEMVISFPDYSY
jgi:hypothetical protein